MSNNIISMRYANALFSIAKENNILDKILEEIQSINSIIKESLELSNIIKNPTINKNELNNFFEIICKKENFDLKILNFLKLLIAKKRISYLPGISLAFENLYLRNKNILNAEIITTEPLNAEQKKEIKNNLEDTTSSKINLINIINKNILGGMIINIGTYTIDSSIKTKLQKLQLQMKGVN